MKHSDVCMFIRQVLHVDQNQKVERPESLIPICSLEAFSYRYIYVYLCARP
jgi:hypothetical protein